MPDRAKKVLARTAAVLFGLLAGWLLLEALLRIGYRALPTLIQETLRDVRITPFTETRIMPPALWRADNYFGSVSRPGAVNELQASSSSVMIHVTTTNWLDPQSHVGFRVDSPDWEPRWPVDAVVVGDSFTFCFSELEDCWVQMLDRDYGMSVVNLGQVATGSTSHLRILQTFGMPYEPRVVIWQWYCNDYNDDYGLAILSGTLPADTYGGVPTQTEPDKPILQWLYRYSAVYAIMYALTNSQDELETFQTQVDPYHVRDGAIDITFGRPYNLSYDMSNPKQEYGWESTQGALEEARDLVAEKNTPMVIVVIPAKEEVYRKLTEPYLGEDGIEMVSEGRLRLLEFCEKEGLICLDMTPVLTARAEAGEMVYYSDDIHLNEAGNALLAETLWQLLVEKGLAGAQ
jgi:hypothetical protein